MNENASAYASDYVYEVKLPNNAVLETITSYGLTNDVTTLDISKFSQTGNTITLDNEYIQSLVKVNQGGEYVNLTLYGATCYYNVKLFVVSLNITTAEGLTVWARDYFKGMGNSEGIYVTLGADINYNGGLLQDNAGYTADTSWEGTFDGQGKTIYNIKIKHGFIPTISANGIIKNVGFANVVKTENQGGIIANQNYGTIDNCFIQGSIYQYGAFVNTNQTSGVISNSLAIVDSKYAVTYSIVRTNNGAIQNTFSIINAEGTIYSYGTSTTGTYASANDYVADTTKDLSGFNSYWKTLAGVNMFEYTYNQSVNTNEPVNYSYVLGRHNDSTTILDLTKISKEITSNENVTIKTADGTSITFSKSGTTSISIENSILPTKNGDLILFVSVAGVEYKIKAFVCDYVFTQSNKSTFANQLVAHPDYYYALAEDITFDSNTALAVNVVFTGTLDGLGHAMKDVKLNYYVIKQLGDANKGGTIKNLAIHVKHNEKVNDGNIGFIGKAGTTKTDPKSIISNVYINIDYNNAGTGTTTRRASLVGLNYTAVISNSVIDIDQAADATFTGAVNGHYYNTTSVLVNSYVITNGDSLNYSQSGSNASEGSTKYSTLADFATNATFDKSAGWESYWTTVDGSVYFNGNKIA